MKKNHMAIILISIIFLSTFVTCTYVDAQVPSSLEQIGNNTNNYLDSQIFTTGIVESTLSRNIYTNLGLEVIEVLVEVGDTVEEGQLLAVLKNREIILAIERETSSLENTRQSTNLSLQDARRMLNNASANLNNNTNMSIVSAESTLNAAVSNLESARHRYNTAIANMANGNVLQILNAEAQLSSATLNKTMAQMEYDNALRDYNERVNLHVVSATHNVASARADLLTIENTYNNHLILYNADIIAPMTMRETENLLAQARARYAEAVASENTAFSVEGRSIEHLREILEAATMTYSDAVALVSATRISQNQEIERLRQDVERFTRDVESARTILNANVNLATQEIERLQTNVYQSEILTNLNQLEINIKNLERQLEDTFIKAPTSGTITRVIATEGAIGLGLMFAISNVDNLRVITAFREYDIPNIYEGMEVYIISSSNNTHGYAGIITRIDPAAMPNSSVVEFETEIKITDTNTSLRIGNNVRVELRGHGD